MKSNGFVAAFLGVAAGLIWLLTASAAHGCTFTGQLEGQTCYPALETLHSVIGPVALVLIVGGIIMYAAGSQQPQAARLPACGRCGFPAEMHPAGRCPGPALHGEGAPPADAPPSGPPAG
jgi:hypothetical protein